MQGIDLERKVYHPFSYDAVGVLESEIRYKSIIFVFIRAVNSSYPPDPKLVGERVEVKFSLLEEDVVIDLVVEFSR
jgi:hypothetical protein